MKSTGLPHRADDARSKRRISLRTAVTVPFLVLIVLTVALIGFFSYRNERTAAILLARDLQAELVTAIEDKLPDFLSAPHQINQLNALAFRDSGYRVDHLSDLRKPYFERLLVFPEVTTCALGTADGEFVGVGRLSDGGFDTAIYDRTQGDTYRHYTMDAGGNPLDLLTDVPDYDARTRSWYVTAETKGGPAWSPVYVWASERNIGISAVLPVKDDAGNLQGVELSALTLGQISDFLGSMRVRGSGTSFIVEPSGLLVATSNGEPVLRASADGSVPERIAAGEARDAVIRAAAEALRAAHGGFGNLPNDVELSVRIGGRDYLLMASPYTDAYGLDWSIVNIIQANELLYAVKDNAVSYIILSTFALIVAAAIGWGITSRVVHPIREISTAADVLAAGEFDRRIAAQPIEEVDRLAGSFTSMAAQLQNVLATLEQRVAERTDDLARTNRLLEAEVAERRQAEALLRQSEEQLEYRVRERTAELAAAQERLVRRERLATLGQMAGTVGHELRAPLAVIVSAVDLLQMDDDIPEATAMEYLGMIKSETMRASRMITDLLDFSRTGVAAVPHKESVLVSSLIEQGLGAVPKPEAVTVSVRCEAELPAVVVDPDHIARVLRNLVTNSYDAMPQTGTLTISATSEPESVAISVADTGCGIPKSQRDHLFEPLFTTKPRGIGLGLVVCQTLVEANGGDIGVESIEGEGTTFTIHLPI